MGMANGTQNNTAPTGEQTMGQTEKYLLGLQSQIQQEMEVATSESAIFRCQGKLVCLQLSTSEANKRSKKVIGSIYLSYDEMESLLVENTEGTKKLLDLHLIYKNLKHLK